MRMAPLYRINLAVEVAGISPISRRRQALTIRDVLTDAAVVVTFAIVIAVSGYIVLTEQRTSKRHATLMSEVSRALRDSTHLDEDIYLAENLRQRQQVITEHMNLLHSIDQGRYVWAHLMDEFAVNAPANLWLESWKETGTAPNDSSQIAFEIKGFAAGNEVISDFIRALVASPFIADVSFSNSQQRTVAEQNVTEFTIKGVTETPDPTLLDLEKIGPDGRIIGPAGSPTLSAPLADSAAAPLSSEVPLLPDARSIPSPAGN